MGFNEMGEWVYPCAEHSYICQILGKDIQRNDLNISKVYKK